MTSTVQSRYTSEEISVWLRGLLTIAWADGHFDEEEKELIANLTSELTTQSDIEVLEPITPAELGATFSHDPKTAENFLRTAVMVAIADGVFSQSEDEILQQFCVALEQQPKVLESLRLVLCPAPEVLESGDMVSATTPAVSPQEHRELLHPIKEWLDHLEIHDPQVARFLCKMIPPQCPFERDVNLFGRKLMHIPAMCKLNPLYDQLVGLRFRALSYLADDCGEDVTPYC
ncbi:nitrogenase [Oscillatoria sp. FACHB-1407]|uniref:Mo-dependent nitrogenase C-terminal domain-containing protein n=1 Tax=Oscillatoria sp. FACHB-1407 TaxID=2692847 RepID=UPI001684F39A|nr:Mo-dependent nitrogenase C-terminal domain-containing protein [Oscillatoria sp. FACHB-1407]MBD2462783.1 nitrogenase [Oscillatoria sp. FACHB-1407]